MQTLTPEQFKQRYGEAGIKAFSTKTPQEEKPGFFSRVGTDLSKRVGDVATSFKKEILPTNAQDSTPLGGIRLGMRTAGAIAGGIGDVIGEGVKSLSDITGITENVAKPVGLAILETDAGKAGLNALKGGMESYNAFKQSNPDTANLIEDVINVASLFPVGAGAKVAGNTTVDVTKGAIKGLEETGTGLMRATDKLASVVAEKVKPNIPVEKAVGEVLQGQTKSIKPGLTALQSVDTKGVKTFSELGNKITEKIGTLAKTVDDNLAQDTTKYALKDLATTQATKAGGNVSTNYVENALKQLDELYTATGDVVAKADIQDLINTAKSQGLTRLEVNDIARTYGSEFGSKAFSKVGDPLTSVNAQMFENTRKGLKDIARAGINGEEAIKADKLMSQLYNVKTLTQKNVEAVNKLMQKIEERGLLEKIGHGVSKYADILTGGSLRGLIGGLLPRGAGYKVLNALDLEQLLERNLKIIQDAGKAKTSTEFTKTIEKLTSPLPKKPNSQAGFISTGKSNPLIEEAKKYKSAEDFVKAHSKQEYTMSHRPTEGVRAFDLTEKVDGEEMIPKDMYTQWYGSRGTKSDLESIKVLKQIKGKPNADVTIYRASPKESFNNGDWVSLSKSYAQEHAEGNGTKVYSKVVKAKDLKWAMDDVNEFGYYPEDYKSQLEQIWKQAHSKSNSEAGKLLKSPLMVGAGATAVGAVGYNKLKK